MSKPLKRHLKILEAAFEAEIARAMRMNPAMYLPLQLGKSKAVSECVGLGYLEASEREVADRFGITLVRGHELTHLGRALYCATCTDREAA